MLKPIFYSFFTKTCVAAINFLILLISSRYLGVSSRGQISIFLLNIAIIQVVNEVYTGYSLIHFLPRYNFKNILLHGFLVTLLIALAGNIVIVFADEQLEGYEWRGFALTLLVILNTFFCVIILGRQRIRYFNLLSVLQPLLLLFVLSFCIFFLHIYTFEAYYNALIFSFSLAFLISFTVVLSLPVPATDKSVYALRPILSKGLIFQGSLLVFMFLNRYNYYLLKENASVGLYSTACTLMESVLLLANAAGPVLLSRSANSAASKPNAWLTLDIAKVSFVFWLIAYLILILLPNTFFIYVMGPGFSGIKQVMLWYGPATCMQGVIIILSGYFAGRGEQSRIFFAEGFALICTLLLSPFLIHKYNIAGAALAANIAFFIVFLISIFQFMKREKINWWQMFVFKGLYKSLQSLSETRN